MDIEESAHELIALTYDAALAPEKWQAVMASLTQTIGTNTALLREVDYTTGKVGLYKTLGFDPAFTKAYREHFVHLDFFAPALMREPIGAVLMCPLVLDHYNSHHASKREVNETIHT